MSARARAVSAVAAAWLLLRPTVASAEGPTHSVSVWTVTGRKVDVELWMPAGLLSRFGANADTGGEPAAATDDALTRSGWLAGDYLSRRLTLATGRGACSIAGAGPSAGALDGGWLLQSWSLVCPSSSGFILRDDAFFEDAPSHSHVARVRLVSSNDATQGSRPSMLEHVFTTGERVWHVGADATPALRGSLARGAPLLVVLLTAVVGGGTTQRRVTHRLLALSAGLAAGGAAGAVGRGNASLGAVLIGVWALALDPFVRGRRTRVAAAILFGAGVVASLARSFAGVARLTAAPLDGWLVTGLVVSAVAAWSGGPPLALDGTVALVAGLTIGRAVPHAGVLGAAVIALPALVLAVVAALPARTLRARPLISAGALAATLAWVLLGG